MAHGYGEIDESQNLHDRSAGGSIDFRNARGDVAGNGVHAFSARRVLSMRSRGLARIAADADLRINLDLAEKRNAEALRHLPALAVAKHVDPGIAVRASKV